MKLYEYMIIYVFDSGLGRIQLTRSEPIRSYDDVVNVENHIKDEVKNKKRKKILKAYEMKKEDLIKIKEEQNMLLKIIDN